MAATNEQRLDKHPENQREITTIYHEAKPAIRADGSVRDEQHLRVAAYARVSTLTEEQEFSYETQVNYFEKYIRHIGSNHVFGYDEIEGVLIPNENAEGIRFAFEAFANGMSYTGIRLKLKEMRISTMRSHGEFDTKTLKRMFRNEIYVGDRLIQKEPPTDPNPNANKNRKQEQPAYESKYVKNDHEGIVSREVWNRVQEKLDRRDALMKMGIKAIDDPHVLMGKVFCGRCGSFMYIVSQNWTGGFQNCWKCRDRMNGKRGNGCKNALISDKDLMNQVMERLGLDPENTAMKDFKTYDKIERIDILDGKIKITLK